MMKKTIKVTLLSFLVLLFIATTGFDSIRKEPQEEKNNEKKTEKKRHLHYDEIYLTDEQAEELDEYMLKFIQQNINKSKEKKSYKVFFTIIDSSDDSNEN
jgi:hypothetical protein